MFTTLYLDCEISPTHLFFVRADREHQDNISVLPCSPRKENADLEKYNRFKDRVVLIGDAGHPVCQQLIL